MLTPLTDTDVYDLCNYLATTTYSYYPVATDYFYDMLVSGCRPRECLDSSLWTLDPGIGYYIQPLKGNNVRFIETTFISPSLEAAIATSTKPYDGLSYRQLRSVLYKILPITNIQTIDKSAIDYVFRYNFVKILHRDGNTDPDIQTAMGWISPLLPFRYYSTQLYTIT